VTPLGAPAAKPRLATCPLEVVANCSVLPAVTGTDVLTAAGEFVPAAVVGVGVGVGGGTMMPPLLQLATTTADAKIAARPMIRTTRATGFTSEEPPIAKATER